MITAYPQSEQQSNFINKRFRQICQSLGQPFDSQYSHYDKNTFDGFQTQFYDLNIWQLGYLKRELENLHIDFFLNQNAITNLLQSIAADLDKKDFDTFWNKLKTPKASFDVVVTLQLMEMMQQILNTYDQLENYQYCSQQAKTNSSFLSDTSCISGKKVAQSENNSKNNVSKDRNSIKSFPTNPRLPNNVQGFDKQIGRDQKPSLAFKNQNY